MDSEVRLQCSWPSPHSAVALLVLMRCCGATSVQVACASVRPTPLLFHPFTPLLFHRDPFTLRNQILHDTTARVQTVRDLWFLVFDFAVPKRCPVVTQAILRSGGLCTSEGGHGKLGFKCSKKVHARCRTTPSLRLFD